MGGAKGAAVRVSIRSDPSLQKAGGGDTELSGGGAGGVGVCEAGFVPYPIALCTRRTTFRFYRGVYFYLMLDAYR